MYTHSHDPEEEDKTSMSAETIAIIGAGSIGTAWAMVFALSGHGAALYDQDQPREAAARAEILQRLDDMAQIMGVPEDSHFARGLVEADIRMKVLAIGLENPGVKGFKSHLGDRQR